MTTIEIPVSKLTSRILLRDYRSLNDIKLSAYDSLHFLIYSLPSSRVTDAFREKLLTEKATFLVNDKTAATIQLHATRIGKLFHQHHEAMLQHFLTLADIQGDVIKHTIELVFKVYDMDENDYSFDNVTKRAQRVKKSRAFFGKKAASTVLQNCQKMSGYLTEEDVLSDAQLNLIVNTYFSNNEHFFYTNKKKFKGLLLTKLRVYVYYTIGKRSVDYICVKFKLPERTVYNKLESFKNDLLYLPPLTS